MIIDPYRYIFWSGIGLLFVGMVIRGLPGYNYICIGAFLIAVYYKAWENF